MDQPHLCNKALHCNCFFFCTKQSGQNTVCSTAVDPGRKFFLIILNYFRENTPFLWVLSAANILHTRVSSKVQCFPNLERTSSGKFLYLITNIPEEIADY